MSELERRDDGEVNLPPGVTRDRRATIPDPESMNRVKRRIGEILVEEGLVQSEQVEEALKIQKSKGGKTVDILIELGFMKQDDFEQQEAEGRCQSGVQRGVAQVTEWQNAQCNR